jgi:hypothetical protein
MKLNLSKSSSIMKLPKKPTTRMMGDHTFAILASNVHRFPEEELQLIHNRNPQIQLPNYKKWTTVICLRQHPSAIDAMFKKVHRSTSHYVKFCLQHKNVKAFGKALNAQNHYLLTL